MSRIQKEIRQQKLVRYRQNGTSQNGESEMSKLKLKDQRPDYVLDRNAMAERMREAVEQCEDYGTTEIAEFCGCDRSLVYEWCRVGGSRPGMDNLTAFCKATGADWEWLMFGVDDSDRGMPKASEDKTVVQMERPLKLERTPEIESLVTRYIGIYELDEVQDLIKKDPDNFLKKVKLFADTPQERTSLAITLNPNQIHSPGIPKFVFQFLAPGTPYPQGTFIGYANDLAPIRGRFCIFAIKYEGSDKFTFSNGFYCPVNDRQISADIGLNFRSERNRGFVLKVLPDKDSDDDVYVLPDNFKNWEKDCRLIGTATYRSEWLDTVSTYRHTGLIERLDRVYESRKLSED